MTLVLQGKVKLVVSQPIINEYHEVLFRPKFSFQRNSVEAFLNELQRAAMVVRPSEQITLSPDEADNRFLECALAAKAHFLVTGNRKHFPFLEYRGTKIVSPAEFARVLLQ